jgi:hypothetical protein
MTYFPEESKVIYESKVCPRRRSRNVQGEKLFDALEWLAAMDIHSRTWYELVVRRQSFTAALAT